MSARSWVIIASALVASPAAAVAQSRSGENAVTQAEDAFGFSIGRESLGIYTASDVRGFSPSAAGNLRIEGLYFDEAYPLQSTLLGSTSIKVGLTAQGYPFAAPSGIGERFAGVRDDFVMREVSSDDEQRLIAADVARELDNGLDASVRGREDASRRWIRSDDRRDDM